MARSTIAMLVSFATCTLLVRQLAQMTFVGSRPVTGSSSVAMRAEADTEVVEEKAVAEGDRLRLKIQSAEGDAVMEACSEVILPSASGQLGILANHAPMMSALDVGVLRYKQDGKWTPIVVMGGFASVDSNSLSVLCNDYEEASNIDMNEAKSEMESATEMLEKAEAKTEKLEATQKVKKAAARLQAAMFMSKK
mmetsp:Transcript_107181/g.149400  ORF Transcript_107181/g.149400 Transcript_107181/m.149400 type:complete len:194 (-) Transcript_107181:177-758(-)